MILTAQKSINCFLKLLITFPLSPPLLLFYFYFFQNMLTANSGPSLFFLPAVICPLGKKTVDLDISFLLNLWAVRQLNFTWLEQVADCIYNGLLSPQELGLKRKQTKKEKGIPVLWEQWQKTLRRPLQMEKRVALPLIIFHQTFASDPKLVRNNG